MPGYTLLGGNANRVASEENLARQSSPPVYQPQHGLQYNGGYQHQQHQAQQNQPSHQMHQMAAQPRNFPSAPSQYQPADQHQKVIIKSAPATPLLRSTFAAPVDVMPYDRNEALQKQNQSDYFFKPYPEPTPKVDQYSKKHAQYSPDCNRLYKCLTVKLPQLRQNRPQLRIVMEGPIVQLGLKKPVEKKRYLFVCDDFMLLCKKLAFGNFAPKWFIPLNRRKAIEDIFDSNYKVPGVEFRVYAPKRDFTFFAASTQEKEVWVRTMNNQLAYVLEKERQRELAKLPKDDFIWFESMGNKQQQPPQKKI